MNSKQISKYYKFIIFPPEVFVKAKERLVERCVKTNDHVEHCSLDIDDLQYVNEEYDNEDEFFAAYRKGFIHAHYDFNINNGSLTITAQPYNSTIFGIQEPGTLIRVTGPSRADVLYVLEIFEINTNNYYLINYKQTQKIFIGHGRNSQRRELKDHLVDLHKLNVITYEVGAQAGYSIKEVLETMLNQSSIAFIVLTGEDKDEYGNFHARENVIHELGLFQGKLGFERAIVLIEDGVKEFSNIHGINQL